MRVKKKTHILEIFSRIRENESLKKNYMKNYTKTLGIIKKEISFDSWRAIQRGEGMGGELSLDSISPFAFIDSVGDSPHTLLCHPIDRCTLDDEAVGSHAFAKINSPPLAEDVISVLKRENFTVNDINKLNSERLVKDRNNYYKSKTKKDKIRKVTYHKHCRKLTLYIKGRKSYVIRYKCGSWRCKRCSIELSQRQFRKIQSSLDDLKYVTFLTLTFDPKKLNNEEAEEKEGKMWRYLYTYLTREIGKHEYYWVREWHKDGRLHKHVLITSKKLWEICEGVYCEADREKLIKSKKGKYYEFKMWLESVVVGRGYGKICDLERPRSQDAITKYCVKEATKSNQKINDYRRNLRMHGSSRNFFKREEKVEKEKNEVFIIRGSIESVKECLELHGVRTKNVKDDIVFEKNQDGKIEPVGSELGSFEV